LYFFNFYIKDAQSDHYHYIVSGLVSVLCPTKLLKAFASGADYAEFRNKHISSIVREKKMRAQDLEQERPEDLADPIMQLQSSLKIKFTFLEEVAILRGKDAFGELSLAAKPALYFPLIFTNNLYIDQYVFVQKQTV